MSTEAEDEHQPSVQIIPRLADAEPFAFVYQRHFTLLLVTGELKFRLVTLGGRDVGPPGRTSVAL